MVLTRSQRTSTVRRAFSEKNTNINNVNENSRVLNKIFNKRQNKNSSFSVILDENLSPIKNTSKVYRKTPGISRTKVMTKDGLVSPAVAYLSELNDTSESNYEFLFLNNSSIDKKKSVSFSFINNTPLNNTSFIHNNTIQTPKFLNIPDFQFDSPNNDDIIIPSLSTSINNTSSSIIIEKQEESFITKHDKMGILLFCCLIYYVWLCIPSTNVGEIYTNERLIL